MRLVTVFGGSGFIGRRIVARLMESGTPVRVAVRHPERVRTGARVEAIRADVWDQATVGPAIAGAAGVVNTVGHYIEGGNRSFDAIHGQGARNVALACAEAGIERLVHISGLGADVASPSRYVRARAIGERLVLEALPTSTVFRPSVVFGEGDAFLSRLTGLVRRLPVIPLFGSGEVELQPVYVGDVATAVLTALERPETAGQTFELGGPRRYRYDELLRLVGAALGRRPWLLPVPYRVWDVLALGLSRLPNAPLSRDQVTLMRANNVVAPGARGFGDLDLAPTPLEAILPACIA